MGLLKKIKTLLMDNFVIINDLKSTRKELTDIKFMLSIMMDHYWESPEKARPAIGGNRQKQLALLQILTDLCKVLDKHKINYWLDYGTLLGAVRHKGFIPWDDDIDIGALKTDSDKIIDIVKTELDDNYDIYTTGERDKYLKCERYYGENRVSIDIFLYKNNNSKMEATFYADGIVYNNPFPEDAIFPLKKMMFENQEFFIPNKYDLYLKKNYGDYHALPKSSHYWPHEKWKSHHNFYPTSK